MEVGGDEVDMCSAVGTEEQNITLYVYSSRIHQTTSTIFLASRGRVTLIRFDFQLT